MIYDSKCPRCIAAHDADEKTALKLMYSGFTFPPKYIAMAVVQDALMTYENVVKNETNQG